MAIRENNFLALIFKILNLNTFCLLSLAFMQVTNQLNLFLAFFIVNIIASLILAPFVYFRNRTFELRYQLKSFLLRSGFNVMGLLTWVSSMHYLGPNESTAISFCIPIFTLMLSVLFCGDSLNRSKLFTFALSLAGAFYIITPRLDGAVTMVGFALAIISSCCWAGYDILCKKQTLHTDFLTQSFKNFFLSAIFCLALVPLFWNEISLDLISNNIFMLVITSILSAINVIFLFSAYKFSKLSLLMPLSYSRLAFMALYSYLFFGYRVEEQTMIGAIIIAIANISLYYMEKLRNQRASNTATSS